MAEDEQKTPLQEAFEQIDEVRAKKQSRPTPLANSLHGLLRPALGTPVRPASPPPTHPGCSRPVPVDRAAHAACWVV
jgi:hypothetical protein